MRLSRLPLMAFFAALLLAPALAADEIVDFHSDIKIQTDASLIVHEVIRVRSDGSYIKHGIFRDFPTRYKDRLGENYIVGFKLLDVRRDGAQEPYALEYLSNGVRIKVGSAATELPPGEYTYELTYTVTRELGFFPDYDELYWNVTGNGWLFPIYKASATVTMPGPVPASDLKLTGYTGDQGSREQNLKWYRIDDSTVGFEATRPFDSGHGMTIVVAFPKRLISEPSNTTRLQWFVEENPIAFIGGAGVIVVLLYYLVAWTMVGRDPRPGVIVVSYEPPSDLSPAAMRFLQHMGYDDRVFACAVVSLAVKKYLAIEQEGKVYRLRKLRAADGKLPAEETDLLQTLFASRTEIEIKSTEATTISEVKKRLTKNLDAVENETLFRKNRRWVWPGVLLSVATMVGMVLGFQGPAAIGFAVLLVWVSVWSAVTVGTICVAAAMRRSGSPAFLIIPMVFGFFELIALGIFAFVAGVLAMLILLALIATNAIGIFSLRTLTPAGRKLQDQVDGFRQYLAEVDSDVIRRLNPPEKTPALFEKCLPYAMSLGVEKAWAQQFAGVLAQAAAAGGGATTYSPSWYSSTDWTSFDSSHFAESFSGGFSSAISSASSPPGSSSGSDGGGSSGGGGGGGGGGGW
ncbi:MAG TPA: DUF2207 domain-containing protein [Terriglobales bacterium]|jgi:uncharacterized membrane protein YgcG|nr:DUF2207 domain-containing protein [Terriglobales bacterium]